MYTFPLVETVYYIGELSIKPFSELASHTSRFAQSPRLQQVTVEPLGRPPLPHTEKEEKKNIKKLHSLEGTSNTKSFEKRRVNIRPGRGEKVKRVEKR